MSNKEIENLTDKEKEIFKISQKTIFEFSEDIKNYRFNTAIAKLREFSNSLQKKDLKNFKELLLVYLLKINFYYYSTLL